MKKIIKPLLCLSIMSISSMSYAVQEKTDETGYLNANNVLSSFSADLVDRVDHLLSEREKQKLEEFKEKINDQLSAKGLNQIIYFRTDNAQMNEKSLNFLTNMIKSLNGYKELSYNLKGFADVRGNEQYNMSLAGKRIDEIKGYLIKMGIPEKRIKESNYGESQSKKRSDREEYFYDRRVEIEIKQ
tara:strand:+ start:48 stop:605 length:558 start_codon:yes stop_codon:yes gene_type:complete